MATDLLKSERDESSATELVTVTTRGGDFEAEHKPREQLAAETAGKEEALRRFAG